MDSKITIVSGAVIFIFLVLLWLLRIVVKYQKNNFKHSLEKQQLQSQFSQTLLQSQLEIKEQTLQNIAYELHDNLGQIASLIKINLNTLQLKADEQSAQKIEDTKELVRQLITDLKSLSVSLNSERVSQLGIDKGLENEVERLNKTGQYEIVMQQEGSIPMLDANTTIILYRMSQEIINNIIKHSGAKRIVLSLNATSKFLILAFSDDGVGFDKEAKIKGGGSGLMNLQSRAKLINAELTIKSSPGSGTVISIELHV
ncbi:MAG TPA: ATP-binding protein [Chryseolinea sp.]|nr:ATP-binding protein [Chryseolinea sp.]